MVIIGFIACVILGLIFIGWGFLILAAHSALSGRITATEIFLFIIVETMGVSIIYAAYLESPFKIIMVQS